MYKALKESGKIQSVAIRRQPRRDRAKAHGYMWDGEMKATLVDGTMIICDIWHHCHDDTGNDWYPSESELDSMWSVKNISDDSGKFYDTYWNTFVWDGHWYLSKLGTFDRKRSKEEILAAIKDGSWVNDPDLKLIV